MTANWCTFHEVAQPRERRTKKWEVEGSGGVGDTIGYVEWLGAWRGYAFRVFRNAWFNPDCLREIAAFVEAQTKHHRTERKAGRDPLASAVVWPPKA